MTESVGFYRYQLEIYRQNGVLASLFVDPEDPEGFIAGYVAALNSRQAAMYAVSPMGRYDGLLATRLSKVYSIMGEDDYALRLRRVLMLRGDQPRETLDVQPDEDLFHAMCRRALALEKIITLWVGESEYVGRVRQLDDMRVTLGALNFFGDDPTDTTLAIRDIDMASLGSEDEEMFQLLSDNRLWELS